MIENDKQLAVVQKQLRIVDEIVEGWRQKLLPHHPKNFAIYAEGAIEQADILRAEIDDYLARKTAKLPEASSTPATTTGQSANVS